MFKTNSSHAFQCMNGLQVLWEEKKLFDVTIEAGGSSFGAHRVILSSCSPYFSAMFTGQMKERETNSVTIHDVPAHVMEAILKYCYTATIEITENNVQELLPAASLLQLIWVQDVCCEFLKSQLCASNCLGVRSFADAHACTDLRDSARSYAQQNYIRVTENEEFLELSTEDLIELIKSEELNVPSEEQVFESVMRWVEHRVPDRQPDLPTILPHVRLPLLEREYLVSRVSSEPLIRQNEICRDLVDEAKDYLLLPDKRYQLSGTRTRPRKPTVTNEMMYAVGGWCSGDAISMVERYDASSDTWKQVACMNKKRCGVGIAVLDNFIYAVGGHDGASYLNSIERYDHMTDYWASNIAPTSVCRTSVGVAVLNGKIYAVGGQDGVSCLNIVECYDPERNVWTKVSRMNTQRLGVAIGVLDGCLYAVGGSNGLVPLSSVERYDPKSDKWAPVSSMQVKRKHLGAAVVDHVLYAIGGRDDTFELSSVESYDPRNDSWSSVVAMNERRSGLGMSVLNNRLYAVGGFNGNSYLKNIEWFDAIEHQWKTACSMHHKRLGCGVGVINLQN